MTTQATRRIPSLELFEKPPRKMKQPTKGFIKQQLKHCQDVVAMQGAEIDRLRAPWWKRLVGGSRRG